MTIKTIKELEKEITKLKNDVQKLKKEPKVDNSSEKWNKLTAYSSVALAIFSGFSLLVIVLNRWWPITC